MIKIEQKDFEKYIPAASFPNDDVFSSMTAYFDYAVSELNKYFGKGIENIYLTEKNVLLPYICNYAFARAIPLLDLKLSPNGFIVTNTEQVSPASKERVYKLHSSCSETANMEIIKIAEYLYDFKNESWNNKEIFIKHFIWREDHIAAIFDEIPQYSFIMSDLLVLDIAAEMQISHELISELHTKTINNTLAELDISLVGILADCYARSRKGMNGVEAFLIARKFIIKNIDHFTTFANSSFYQSKNSLYENSKGDAIFFFGGF